MNTRAACALTGMCCLSIVAALRADTLILKDGRRVDGQVIAIRDGVIEFDQRRAQGGRERVMIDRVEVRRIELDDVADEGTPAARGAGAPRRPAGLRERETVVDATVAWSDTGVDVRADQTVYFLSKDRIRSAPGRRDGPEGEHNSPGGPRPMPGQRRAALIGRIGDSKDYFIVGDNRGPIRMGAAGRLYLGVNDDTLQDNAGSFRVTVFY